MNNNIKPHYVDFNTAKLLKEKGFKYYCPISYWNQELTYNTPGYPLENGETSQENYYDFERYYAPEQHIVVEWLRINYGIWIYTYPVAPFIVDDEDYPKIVWVSKICSLNQVNFEKFIDADNGLAVNHHSPEKAYNAAFDYILNNLI